MITLQVVTSLSVVTCKMKCYYTTTNGYSEKTDFRRHSPMKVAYIVYTHSYTLVHTHTLVYTRIHSYRMNPIEQQQQLQYKLQLRLHAEQQAEQTQEADQLQQTNQAEQQLIVPLRPPTYHHTQPYVHEMLEQLSTESLSAPRNKHELAMFAARANLRLSTLAGVQVWCSQSYNPERLGPTGAILPSTLIEADVKAIVDRHFSQHSDLFKQVATAYYCLQPQPNTLVFGNVSTGFRDNTLVPFLNGDPCIRLYSSGYWYEGSLKNSSREGQGLITYPKGSYYQGSFLNNKRHGTGTFSDTQGITYTGQWQYDHRNGPGVLTSPSKTIEGTFVRNEVVGTIKASFKVVNALGERVIHEYTGEYSNNSLNGHGVMVYSNNQSYDGEWLNGKRHGFGEFKSTDGSYEGEWKDDKPNGHGVHKHKYTDSTGKEVEDVYIGQFKDSCFDGYGTLTSTLGTKYAGDWVKDERHGHGVFTKQKVVTFEGANIDVQSVYTGQWVNNRQQGEGRIEITTLDTGKVIYIYEGEFKDGRKHGQGSSVDMDGYVYEGDFAKNHANGMCKILYVPDNTFYSGVVVKDMKHGKGVFNSTDGHYVEGEFKDDMLHGEGVCYGATGAVYRGTLVNNQPHGKGSIVYPNGCEFIGEFKEGKKYKGMFKFQDKNNWYLGEFNEACEMHNYGVWCNKYGIYKGMFHNSKMHGQGSFTFNDGTVITGEWVNDKNQQFSEHCAQLTRIAPRVPTPEGIVKVQEAKARMVVTAKRAKLTVANLSAKTRRLMKEMKVKEGVTLMEKLVSKLPKPINLSAQQVQTLVDAAKKMIAKKD